MSNTPDGTLANNQAGTPQKKKKMIPLSYVLIPLAIIFGGIFLAIVGAALAPKPSKKPMENKAPLVEVVEVRQGDVVFEIETQGSILPRTETTMVSEVSGVVKKVSSKFVAGGFFRKGELLLEIDPITYEVALLQAQARLDAANAKLIEEEARGKQAEKEWSMTGRKKSNAPILALRKPQLQQAKADVKAAQADVKNAQIKLDRTRIIAPYDAMVKAKMVDIGQYVSTGTQLATTFAVDYAEIRLPIKEKDYPYVEIPRWGSDDQQGSRVELTAIRGGKLRQWQTYITRAEGVVDDKSRVNYVIAQIVDPYGVLTQGQSSEPLKIGTFVKAKIYGATTPNIITIPRKAVRNANDIYLVDENRQLDLAKVEILRSDTNNVYVSSGLEDGDKVVITKLAAAIEGMQLRLEGDEPQADESAVAANDEEQESESEAAGTLADQGGSQ